MESPQAFVEEIDFNELQFHEVVGKGAFGVVSRAKWRGVDVAVKLIETASERKAFLTELKQLSRVNNPYIVKLYGACTIHPVCLVMEYAEGGSLYNVLHGSGPQPHYTAAHAMSWALQCAKGVEYLHNMKPKALIHRDLKPPNLLLIAGGTVLKICDFGTACDIQTHMTNNKGSAAWMAPEVFEGSNYSEKCDVFSCGIILWEVFTRRKPFDEIGGPAFRIMWAVHNGTRPPPIKNLPKPLETLMIRCWSGNPNERPSMAEVARIMAQLSQFFKGADEPLVYPQYSEYDYPDYTYRRSPFGSNYSTPPSNTVYSHQSSPTMAESRTSTISDTVRHPRDRGEPVPVLVQAPPVRTTPPVVIEEENKGQKSAPASLAASRESLFDVHRNSRAGTPVDPLKRYSADLDQFDILSQVTPPAKAFVRGHRRSASYGTPLYGPSSQTRNNPQAGRGHRRVGSDEVSRVTPSPIVTTSSVSRTDSPVRLGMFHTNTYPGNLNLVRESTPPNRSISYPPPPSQRNQESLDQGSRPSSWTSVVHEIPQSAGAAGGVTLADSYQMNMVHLSLDAQLQPLIPYPSCQESLDIFREHQMLAQEYLRVQTEIALLTQRKHELMKEFEQDVQNQHTSNRLAEEYTQLSQENESLMLLHKNMKKQVEQIRQKRCGVN